MLTLEQLKLRKTMLCASDMVILAGVSPYAGASASSVFASKVTDDVAVTEPTDPQHFGNVLEGPLLKLLARKCGMVDGDDQIGLEQAPKPFLVLQRRVPTMRHRIFSWAGATPDAIIGEITDHGKRATAVAEAKVVGARMMRAWGDEAAEPPEHVLVQVHWQMLCVGVRRAYVTALLGGTEHRIHEVERDDDLSAELLRIGQDFWENHVMPRVPPPPDGSDAAYQALQAVWPKPRESAMVTAGLEATELCNEYTFATEQARAFDRQANEAKQKLCAMIGDAEGIRGGNWQATWKLRSAYERKACTVAAGRVFSFKKWEG